MVDLPGRGQAVTQLGQRTGNRGRIVPRSLQRLIESLCSGFFVALCLVDVAELQERINQRGVGGQRLLVALLSSVEVALQPGNLAQEKEHRSRLGCRLQRLFQRLARVFIATLADVHLTKLDSAFNVLRVQLQQFAELFGGRVQVAGLAIGCSQQQARVLIEAVDSYGRGVLLDGVGRFALALQNAA